MSIPIKPNTARIGTNIRKISFNLEWLFNPLYNKKLFNAINNTDNANINDARI